VEVKNRIGKLKQAELKVTDTVQQSEADDSVEVKDTRISLQMITMMVGLSGKAGGGKSILVGNPKGHKELTLLSLHGMPCFLLLRKSYTNLYYSMNSAKRVLVLSEHAFPVWRISNSFLNVFIRLRL